MGRVAEAIAKLGGHGHEAPIGIDHGVLGGLVVEDSFEIGVVGRLVLVGQLAGQAELLDDVVDIRLFGELLLRERRVLAEEARKLRYLFDVVVIGGTKKGKTTVTV